MGGGGLPEEARQWLLRLARDTIAQSIGAGEQTSVDSVPEGAQAPGGCFVSLHTKAGALRGCIGTFDTSRPLWQAVREMAVAAATRDPRFAPLPPDELDGCVVEISALSPTRPTTPEEVEVGRHGICVERGALRGVLLPQVATDHGWDRETFLNQTCVKAGLPADAWRDGSVGIEVFEAEVFSEGH